jgi:hypothetical protein
MDEAKKNFSLGASILSVQPSIGNDCVVMMVWTKMSLCLAAVILGQMSNSFPPLWASLTRQSADLSPCFMSVRIGSSGPLPSTTNAPPQA